jgi:hypothetical protein
VRTSNLEWLLKPHTTLVITYFLNYPSQKSAFVFWLWCWVCKTFRSYEVVFTGEKAGNSRVVNGLLLYIYCCNDVMKLNFWHRSFTYNSNKSPTWCNNFSVYYPDVCLQLNMFRAFSRPSSGAQWLQWQPLVLPSYRGDSRVVFVVGPAGPPTNTARLSPRYEGKTRGCHCSHWTPDDGRETPETCWAVNKR